MKEILLLVTCLSFITVSPLSLDIAKEASDEVIYPENVSIPKPNSEIIYPE